MKTLFAVLALLLAGFGPQARAVDVCVANVAELNVALANATFASTKIKLERGTYAIGDIAVFQSADLSLLGGYGPGCNSRLVDPSNTVLQQTSVDGGVAFDVASDLTLEGITFADNKYGVYLFASDGYADVDPTIDLVIRNSVFRGASALNGNLLPAGLAVVWNMRFNDSDSVGHLRLVNSLIYDNDDGPGATCALRVISYSLNFSASLINNTIANNASDNGACLELYDAEAFMQAEVYNNIFWNNGSLDLFSNNTYLQLVNNVIGSGSYPTPFIPAVGTQTSDPQFVNAGSGNFNLQSTSPAVNSGSNSAPGGLPTTDLDGGPRLVGSKVDRGALESAVTDAFFLVVTNTNDSGTGSLRQALINANLDPDFTIVSFDIPGACPHRIDLDSLLPNVTQAVLIDGYSQPGSSPNDALISDNANWCVRLHGQDARAPTLFASSTARPRTCS